MNNGVFNLSTLAGASQSATGYGKIYADTDGKLYYWNDTDVTPFDLTANTNIVNTDLTLSADYLALKDPIYTFRTDDETLGFRISSARIAASLIDDADSHVVVLDTASTVVYNNKIYWVFNDVLMSDGQYRNNAFAESSDFDASDGIRLKYKQDLNGDVTAILPANHTQGENFVYPNNPV